MEKLRILTVIHENSSYDINKCTQNNSYIEFDFVNINHAGGTFRK